MSVSDNDAFVLLQQFMPPGMTKWQAFSSTGGVGKFWKAIAQAVNKYGWTVLATLRAELGAMTMSARLPDWEQIIGVAGDAVATLGSLAQRRARVLARRREFGGPSLPSVRAVIGPLLGYADPTQLQIIEVSRATLTAQHTYAGDSAAHANVDTQTITVPDGGAVSAAGAVLKYTSFQTSDTTGNATLRLTGPTGTYGQFDKTLSLDYLADLGVIAPQSMTFYFPGAAGFTAGGVWTITLTMDIGIDASWATSALFVEGCGRYTFLNGDGSTQSTDGLGSEIFEWNVLVDNTLAGVASAINVADATTALARIKPAHTRCSVAFKASTGSQFAIYDDAKSTYNACLYDT